MDEKQVLCWRQAPPPSSALRDELKRSLENPLDFPPFHQAVIPDDRVALAVDRNTPEVPLLIDGVWSVLKQCGVKPENVVIIQPAGGEGSSADDPRILLAEEVRRQIGWKIHAPEQKDAPTYLAATALGERIYLARDVVDADVVVSIGTIGYDPVIGFRGTNSVFYPGLSTLEAQKRAMGQGHRELRPHDERPLRRMIDEVGWLLGTQFSVQVIPAAKGGASHVLAGIGESVLQRGKELLEENWRVPIERRPSMVVVGVDCDSTGHGWEQLCSAMAVARGIVEKGGKIAILSDFKTELDAGMELIRENENPRDAIRPLQELAPVDLVSATQLADSVDWARVYLHSRLESGLVEDLFMVPLDNDAELERLLKGGGSSVFIESAQHAYAEMVVPTNTVGPQDIDG